MQKIIIASLFSLFSMAIYSQPKEKRYKINSKLIIADVGFGKPKLLVDKKRFLNTINHVLNIDSNQFDSVSIKDSVLEKQNFYYLNFKCKTTSKTMVKWLFQNGKNLVIADTKKRKFKSLNFFVIAEGDNKCYPKLNLVDDKFFWSCGDLLSCPTEEYKKLHPCSCTKLVYIERL